MKALKRTLTLLLTAAVMTAAIPYAAYATEETATVSDGTIENAEQIGISTAEEFLAMESGKSYYLKNDIDFAGKTYVTLVATFNGVLDGRGHALKNFTLANESTTADGHMGVFGKVCDGGYTTVKNLVIGSAEQPISMTNNTTNAGYNGFLAGQATKADYTGYFENITVYGNYTYNGGGNCFAGGLIGRAYKFVAYGCTMNGSLTDATQNAKEKNFGGLIGLSDANTTLPRPNVIENCTNHADITAVGTGNVRVGGVIGFSGSLLKIDSCTNTGDISGTKYAGGLVGDRYASDLYIRNSRFTGTLPETGVTNKGILLGGSEGNVSARYLYITGCDEGLNTADTADGVIEISSLEDLQTKMTEAGKIYRLTQDLDLKDSEPFTNSVFSATEGFSGIFDGNGHSIYNFSINATGDAGFFNILAKNSNTMILNLSLGTAENPVAFTSTATNGTSVGGLTAYCHNNTTYRTLIDHVDLHMNIVHTGGKVNFGGFIGTTRTASILNSTFSGDIRATMTNLGSNWFNLGAYVGKVDADHTLFYNCANYADMTVTTTNGSDVRAAGMVGYSTKNNAYIRCANFGDINVTSDNASSVPAAAGMQVRPDGTSTILVLGCTNFGDISAKYASGFFAWSKNPLVLINSVNFGTVSGADATKDAFYNYSGDLVINKETQTELPVTKLACTTAASDLNFTMQTGASVRLETPAGLRFQATVNTYGLYWERMSMYAEVGYGMLISPAVFVSGAGAFTREALDAYAKKLGYTGDQSAYVAIDNTDKWFTGTEGCIAGTLANIQTNHYNAKFSGLAYLDLTVNGQTVRTLYAGAEQSRSVKEVATSALNDLLYKAADGKLYRADGSEYTEADAADYTNVVESGKTLTGVDGTLDLVSPYTEAERTVLSGFAN